MKKLLKDKFIMFLFFVGATALLVQPALAENKNVDGQALKLFNRAASFLAGQKQVSVIVEAWEDMSIEGNKTIQFSKTIELNLHRPDHFKVMVETIQPEKTFFYNGRNLTCLDGRTGFFGVAPAPATIDETVAVMETKYGITFPLDDILLSRPFNGAPEKAQSGQYYGLQMVSGKKCHHLAFQHDAIDWQMWVEDGILPLIRKIVITHKTEQGFPQFTALFNHWDFTTPLPDYLFTFEKMPGVIEVDMIQTLPGKPVIQK